MKSRIFLVAVILLLLVSCANAIVVNTTEFGVSSGGVYTSIIINGAGTNDYSAASDHTINQFTERLYGDDTSSTATLTFKNGEIEPITINTVSTGLTSAQYEIRGCNGNTKIIPYTMWVPWSKNNPPILRMRYLFSNITNQFYLYTGLTTDKGDPFDVSTEAYCMVSPPDINPIISINQLVAGGDGLEAIYQSVYSNEIPTDVIQTQQGGVCAAGDLGCWVGKIWGFIFSIIIAAATIAGTALNLLPFILNITNFIFAGQVFFGLIMLYTAFAVMLAIEDSDDIFKAFGKFWRTEMKLFKFFMQLFGWIKDLIKWW